MKWNVRFIHFRFWLCALNSPWNIFSFSFLLKLRLSLACVSAVYSHFLLFNDKIYFRLDFRKHISFPPPLSLTEEAALRRDVRNTTGWKRGNVSEAERTRAYIQHKIFCCGKDDDDDDFHVTLSYHIKYSNVFPPFSHIPALLLPHWVSQSKTIGLSPMNMLIMMWK